MEIVLLERIEKLGQMGDVVRVKDGYARNYLLPKNKALRATKANLARFEQERAQLEARNLELKNEAQAVADKVEGLTLTVIRQAGDTGQLYGSVSTRDISEKVTEGGATIARGQVVLDSPIKVLGLHPVRINLHPEVAITVTMNVARTEEEAERQARGEDVTADRFDEEDDEAIAVEDVFEDEELAKVAAEELSDEDGDEESEADGSEAADTSDETEASEESSDDEEAGDEPKG